MAPIVIEIVKYHVFYQSFLKKSCFHIYILLILILFSLIFFNDVLCLQLFIYTKRCSRRDVYPYPTFHTYTFAQRYKFDKSFFLSKISSIRSEYLDNILLKREVNQKKRRFYKSFPTTLLLIRCPGPQHNHFRRLVLVRKHD